MEKECSRCQAGDNPNHTHNTEYGKLARSKSKSSLSNPNHSSPAHSKALEKKKEGTHKHSWDTAPGMDEKICKGCNIHSPKDSQSKHYIA
jgi:hypothetical protein